MSHRMHLSSAKSRKPCYRSEAAQQQRIRKLMKLEEFVVSKTHFNACENERSPTDKRPINGTNSNHTRSYQVKDDSFIRERESYERTIGELRFTLAKERLEHNMFLKDMADLLAEFDWDAEIERPAVPESSPVVMILSR